MVRAGIGLPALMQLEGHANIQTTMVYVQVTPLEVYQQYARCCPAQTAGPWDVIVNPSRRALRNTLCLPIQACCRIRQRPGLSSVNSLEFYWQTRKWTPYATCSRVAIYVIVLRLDVHVRSVQLSRSPSRDHR
jgi:hypothetical protein